MAEVVEPRVRGGCVQQHDCGEYHIGRDSGFDKSRERQNLLAPVITPCTVGSLCQPRDALFSASVAILDRFEIVGATRAAPPQFYCASCVVA